ncbi:MAG TPA: methyltransferase [Microlunatus sp.]
MELIGAPAHAALGRNNTTPARRVLADDHGPVATLAKLWPLQATVSADDLDRALPGMGEALQAAGLVEVDHDQVRALIDLRPYGSDDGAAGWIFSDLTPGLDGPMTPVDSDFVLGVSPASMTLAELTMRRPVDSALDLGTGCGVQSLHLARHARRVVATDVNQRALAMARATMRLNGVEVDIREGNLYEPVADETFDLIVTNPPYVMSPPSTNGRLTYREAGLVGDELVRQVVVGGAARLNPGGSLQVLGNWAQLAGRPWQERLQDWVEATGCDAHILRREQLDPYEYIEIWLADAGLVGDPQYRSRYDAWCDYFERLGIESVGMGWLTLTRAERDRPAVSIEDWPYPVEQPIGPAWADRRDAVELTRRLTDAEVLNRRWQLAGDVAQETVGKPGAVDPEAIVFRQQRGFRRAVRAGTGLAGALGACDGELRLDQIVGGVAMILGVDAGALAGELLADVRQLIVDGLLSEASTQDVE